MILGLYYTCILLCYLSYTVYATSCNLTICTKKYPKPDLKSKIPVFMRNHSYRILPRNIAFLKTCSALFPAPLENPSQPLLVIATHELPLCKNSEKSAVVIDRRFESIDLRLFFPNPSLFPPFKVLKNKRKTFFSPKKCCSW